ncbi:hypothetical protein MASR2M69_14590 [Bacteroidota bacterium]
MITVICTIHVTESGKQYRVYCRKKGSTDAPEEIIFDVNKMAEGKKAFRFAGYEVSPDNKLAAFAYNETGSFAEFYIKVKNLETGEELPEFIEKASSFAWANDNKTMFYTVIDNALRPYKVFRHTLGSGKKDEVVYEEKDARFNTYVYRAKTGDFILFGSSSTSTSEVSYISADTPGEKPVGISPKSSGCGLQHNTLTKICST